MKFRFSQSGLYITSKGYFLVKYNDLTKKFDCKSLIGDEIISYLHCDIFTEEYDEISLIDILTPILHNKNLSIIFKNLDFDLFCDLINDNLVSNEKDNFIEYLEVLKNIQISDVESTISPFEIVGQSYLITDENLAKQYHCALNSRISIHDCKLLSHLNLPVRFSNLTINYSNKGEFTQLFNGNTNISLFELLYTIISNSFSFIVPNLYNKLDYIVESSYLTKNSYSHNNFNNLRYNLNINKVKKQINSFSIRLDDLLNDIENNYPSESIELKNELLSQINNILKKP